MSTPSTQSNRIEDAALRANTYSLLASLLRSPPDRALLAILMRLDTRADASIPLERSWHALKLAAAESDLELLNDEFHALFIGLGHGEVIPYGSWYQTGYLMDKPLARLRQTLSGLGVTRRDDIHEPEGDIAALCECMALLIDDAQELASQRDFYREHLHPWLGTCFRDIERAPSARFYRSVASLGQQFAALEQRYLDVGDNRGISLSNVEESK